MKLIYIVILPLLMLFSRHSFSQNGGGIYAENGAKVIGCVVAENRAAGNGFGVCGGDVELLNCTVGNNIAAEKLTKDIDVGYIFCENNKIVSREIYESEGRTDAAGVVFWVNSDRYAKAVRAYVVALKQEKKARGEFFVSSGVEAAVFDTACYTETMALATVSEAAIYCQGYMAGTVLEKRWLMPAGFQLSCLFTTHRQVEKTLDFLESKGVDIDHFEEDIYWSCSETYKDFWGVHFTSSVDNGKPSGVCLGRPGDEQHWVRPVLIYGM